MNASTTRRSLLGGAAAIAALLGAKRAVSAPTDDDIVEMVQHLATMMKARTGGNWRGMVNLGVGVIVLARNESALPEGCEP